MRATMIPKHGKVHQYYGNGKVGANSHLEPILRYVTKGVADAKENIVLEPKACDVKGAKRFNGQQCVIARALTREHKPQAVAIGRSLAYAVFDGLAVRFEVPMSSRKVIEEFDAEGRVRRAPILLQAVRKEWALRKKGHAKTSRSGPYKKRASTQKFGVRCVGGGMGQGRKAAAKVQA